jgi:hypothetical protein
MTATQSPAAARSVAVAGPRNTPMRRRWGRVAVGAVLALIGGLVSAQLYLTAGDRVEVVVVADDIDRFSEIRAEDLTTARVAADPTVEMISATSRDALVGRVAAYDLVAGSLLTSDHLHPEDDPLVAGDQSIVPLELPSSQVPSSVMTPGTEIRVVLEEGGSGARCPSPRPDPGSGILWKISVATSGNAGAG